jgi:hypothetical protein
MGQVLSHVPGPWSPCGLWRPQKYIWLSLDIVGTPKCHAGLPCNRRIQRSPKFTGLIAAVEQLGMLDVARPESVEIYGTLSYVLLASLYLVLACQQE